VGCLDCHESTKSNLKIGHAIVKRQAQGCQRCHAEIVKAILCPCTRTWPVNASDSEIIRQVNAAYKLLLDYVSRYRFSFAEDEFYEQNPEERVFMQFADTPLWGKR
jgi:hypothetical protein